jgi:hypothetical protein
MSWRLYRRCGNPTTGRDGLLPGGVDRSGRLGVVGLLGDRLTTALDPRRDVMCPVGVSAPVGENFDADR